MYAPLPPPSPSPPSPSGKDPVITGLNSITTSQDHLPISGVLTRLGSSFYLVSSLFTGWGVRTRTSLGRQVLLCAWVLPSRTLRVTALSSPPPRSTRGMGSLRGAGSSPGDPSLRPRAWAWASPPAPEVGATLLPGPGLCRQQGQWIRGPRSGRRAPGHRLQGHPVSVQAGQSGPCGCSHCRAGCCAGSRVGSRRLRASVQRMISSVIFKLIFP